MINRNTKCNIHPQSRNIADAHDRRITIQTLHLSRMGPKTVALQMRVNSLKFIQCCAVALLVAKGPTPPQSKIRR